MRAKEFIPTHYIRTDDGYYLYVCLSYSKKHQEVVVNSVTVELETGRFLGSVVESRIHQGYKDSKYFLQEQE